MNREFGIRISDFGISNHPTWVTGVEKRKIRNSKFEIRNGWGVDGWT